MFVHVLIHAGLIHTTAGSVPKHDKWTPDIAAGADKEIGFASLQAQKGLPPHHLALGQFGSFAGTEAGTSMMVGCLLGVPVVLAIVAFAIVEAGLRHGSDFCGNLQQRGSQRQPLVAGPRTSAAQSVYQSHQQATAQSLAPCNSSAWTPWANSASAPTSSLLAPPAGTNSLLGNDQREFTMLLVREGVEALVSLDGQLTPHPEQRTVNLRNVRDNNIILCAHVAENSTTSQIRVEINASGQAHGIPVAVLDTSEAIFPKGGPRPPPERRRVLLQRVIGEDKRSTGFHRTCWIVPSGRGVFLVKLAGGPDGDQSGDVALTVYTSASELGFGSQIEKMVDPEGQTLVQGQRVVQGHASGLLVRPGTDMALVACIVLSVQKLG